MQLLNLLRLLYPLSFWICRSQNSININFDIFDMVPKVGLEPTSRKAADFKSAVFAISPLGHRFFNLLRTLSVPKAGIQGCLFLMRLGRQLL